MVCVCVTHVKLGADPLVLGGEPLSEHGLLEAILGSSSLHGQETRHLVWDLSLGLRLGQRLGLALLLLQPGRTHTQYQLAHTDAKHTL